jgi:hypothetical protein
LISSQNPVFLVTYSRNFNGASKKIGLQINIEETKYMLLYHHKNVGQSRDVKVANRLFGNLSQFMYMGRTVTNQNLIEEKIKRRLNS